jgi:hypothetical protein
MDETLPLTGSSETLPLTGSSETLPLTGSSETLPLTGSSETLPLTGSSETLPSILDNIHYDIIYIILHSICNSYTYKSARLTCKKWNKILKDVLRFDDQNKLIEKIVFTPQLIISYYPNNKIKRKMIIKMYGEFVFFEYDKNGLQTISMKNKSPYYLEYNKVGYGHISKRIWDLRTPDLIENTELTYPTCSIC